MSEPASRGSSGMSWMTCLAMSRRLMLSASASSSLDALPRRAGAIFAFRYGPVCVISSSRMRVSPCRMSE